MEKLEMRARARASARASRVFTPGRDQDLTDAPPPRAQLPAALDVIDEAHARAACRPMGELEYVVQSVDAKGRMRAMYVIVPDLALKAHYERHNLSIEAGCRVLLDAEALLPIAVLRIAANEGEAPHKCAHAAGFNPYFDLPPA
jgi:hypothetical protein